MSDLDVLIAGRAEPHEVRELEGGGLRVGRAASVLGAVARLRSSGACVVLADGSEIEGREKDAFQALRDAGSEAVVALYRPALAYRAERAIGLGADAAVVLPAYPGELEAIVSAVRSRRSDNADEFGAGGSLSAPVTESAVLPGGVSLEALVGDTALIHRSIDDVDRLLDQITASFRRRSGATRVSLMLADRQRRELVMHRADGLPRDETWPPVPFGEGFAGRVAASGRPLLVRDLKELGGGADETPAPRPRDGYRTDSFLILPLTGAEGVQGVMCLADKADGSRFDQDDLRSLGFLAEQAGQGLENGLKLRHMRDLAVIDELTGLFNRRYFQRALEREVQRARRYDRSLTVAVFDLDEFKKFNDLCGHPAGDKALALVGEILRTSLREVDIVARHGGEEFAVILPETSARPAPRTKNPFPFLERLRRNVEEAHFPGEEKLPSGRLTLSGGLACFPDDAATADELFEKADRSLYVSKARGRNRITYRGKSLDS